MTILKQKNFEASLQDRINNKLISISNNSNQIDESIAYALSNPGKRVRPLLVYLVGDALDIPKDNLDSIAIASIHTLWFMMIYLAWMMMILEEAHQHYIKNIQNLQQY